MEFERIGCVSMRHFFFEIRWQVDDRNSFEGASRNRISTERNSTKFKLFSLLDADATADTQEFGDEGYFVGRFHLDTQFSYNSTGQSRALNKHLIPDTRPF